MVVDDVFAWCEIGLAVASTRNLGNSVDHFVIVDSPTTVSREPKPLQFKELRPKWLLPEKVSVEVIKIPNHLYGSEMFEVEFLFRHELIDRLQSRLPVAKILVDDLDEIPSREQVDFIRPRALFGQVASVPMRVCFRKENSEYPSQRKESCTPPGVFSGTIRVFETRSLSAKHRIAG